MFPMTVLRPIDMLEPFMVLSPAIMVELRRLLTFWSSNFLGLMLELLRRLIVGSFPRVMPDVLALKLLLLFIVAYYEEVGG